MIRSTRLLQTVLAASLVLASAAHAQVAKGQAEALPVLNKQSGKVEAFLLLEPMGKSRQFGNHPFGATGAGQLGLVCNSRASLSAAIGNLVDNCAVASLGANDNRSGGIGASLVRAGTRLGLGIGNTREALPAWLTPGNRAAARVDANSLTLMGQRNVGREATVSFGGTIARARLVSPDAVPSLSDRWDIKTLTVGANVGDFGANIIGRVVDSPVTADRWQGVGIGLSWRTPWSGQLSVGAENVITRGRNPFAAGVRGEDEGAVPYVRYQQDL